MVNGELERNFYSEYNEEWVKQLPMLIYVSWPKPEKNIHLNNDNKQNRIAMYYWDSVADSIFPSKLYRLYY